MLRRIAVIATITSLFFVACSDNDGSSTGTTRPTSETVTTDTKQVVVDEYTRQEKILLNTLRNGSYSDQFDDETDARIVEVGHDICDELDSGKTVNGMIDELRTELDKRGSSEREAKGAGYFLGASIAALCPEHKSELNN